MATTLVRTPLTRGWTLFETNADDREEIPVNSVPSVAHLDLLAAGRIPDPFVGFNELDVEWVGRRSWTYQTKLPRPPGLASRIDLVFEGLDTFADVQLNGKSILKSDNMFVSHRVDVTNLLASGSNNDLRIDFQSAIMKAREMEKLFPNHEWVRMRGDKGRVLVRKAQYHWCWDWGPLLNAAGPWRPVWLETYHARIEDLWVDVHPSQDNTSASGKVVVRSQGNATAVKLRVTLENAVIFENTRIVENSATEFNISIASPRLWYPHGYGAQALYQISATLLNGQTALDEVVKQTGLRRAELIRDQDEVGESFYFRINGVDVFAGGSNWIPAESFLPRLTREKYRGWLQLMVEGNQNMTRVWGGGIYEDDAFYDTCDELGIMVWQDFMFACGNYPAHPDFLESVEREVRCNLQRMRHHPSIVLYAGNNEDYMLRDYKGLEIDRDERAPEAWLRSKFPSRYTYEKLLPQILAKEIPNMAYWPSSPWSGETQSTFDRTRGDVHVWQVWHDTHEKYQRFVDLGGRFNSEFGVEAFPVLQTTKGFASDPKQLHPRSAVVDFHNKADGHDRRLGLYMSQNFRPVASLEAFTYHTQLLQSEAMSYAYRPWRRQWGEKARLCGGALVWQLNDCWPTTSWALVDYHLRRKPAFYTVKRCLAHMAVGVVREHWDWSSSKDSPPKGLAWKLWVVNSKLEKVAARVELREISAETGKEVRPGVTWEGELVANGTTEIMEGVDLKDRVKDAVLLVARLIVDGVCVARDVDWPQPLKYLPYEQRGLRITKEGREIRISTDKPVKGLVVEEVDGIKFSDNCIDVIPGDEQVITVKESDADLGLLVWRHLGREEGFRMTRENKI